VLMPRQRVPERAYSDGTGARAASVESNTKTTGGGHGWPA